MNMNLSLKKLIGESHFLRGMAFIFMAGAMVGPAMAAASTEDPDTTEVIADYSAIDITGTLSHDDELLLEEIDRYFQQPRIPGWLNAFAGMVQNAGADRSREKRVDASFIAVPTYTREESFGLRAAVTGLYRINRSDTLPEPSLFMASAGASLNGFYTFRSNGHMLFPDNRWRLDHTLEVARKALHFWGADLWATEHNEKSKYVRIQVDFRLDALYRINGGCFYAGPYLHLNFTDIRSAKNPEYLEGLPRRVFTAGLGASLILDTRDDMNYPHRGVRSMVRPVYYPGFATTGGEGFWGVDVTFDFYKSLWAGAVAAFDLYGGFRSDSAPWTMREMIAADRSRMRGYYMGRYISDNQIAAQLELRQHVWGPVGLAAWGGASTMFSRGGDSHASSRLWLPNGGVGLRLSFKKNINARIDFGFGRHTHGFMFALGESF